MFWEYKIVTSRILYREQRESRYGVTASRSYVDVGAALSLADLNTLGGRHWELVSMQWAGEELSAALLKRRLSPLPVAPEREGRSCATCARHSSCAAYVCAQQTASVRATQFGQRCAGWEA